MQVYRFSLSDIKVGMPISQVDYELVQEGFSKCCFPGGSSEIRLETTSIVYSHQDGRRSRIELEHGAVKTVESFRMAVVIPRFY